METVSWRCLLLLINPWLLTTLAWTAQEPAQDNQHGGHGDEHDIHGGVPMGIPDDGCDNGQWNIQLDWDTSSDVEFRCHDDPIEVPDNPRWPIGECLKAEHIPQPIHVCLQSPIQYADIPPRGGPHRPLWPVYGEYVYAPPQRWVHSLEHGAAVFLYHPCADPTEVDRLRRIADSCLRRHIITPYRHLPRDKPFAVVTWGCRLEMEAVSQEAVVDFVKTHALRTLETRVTEDGQYNFGLLRRAPLVTDLEDSELCPYLNQNADPLLDAEHMLD